MQAKIIKTEADHEAALARIDELFDASPGTPEADELELLVHLVEEYEEETCPIPLPDPIEAIRFRMDQAGLKQADLVPYFGSKSRVSEVLNGKRDLTLAMIRKLRKGLGIPADVLLQEPGSALAPQYEGIDFSRFPLTEMLKRKWFPKFRGKRRELLEQAEEIVGPLLFPGGVDCREQAMATRQSVRRGSEQDEYALWAWKAKVLQLGQGLEIGEYVPEAMTEDFMKSVVQLSRLGDGPLQARRLLARNGIAMVVLHYLPGTHLDGAAMVRQDGKPIVALTLRHDRLDNFWFTLAHELAHVVLHLATGQGTSFLDDLESEAGDDSEEAADRLAAEILLPPDQVRASGVVKSANPAVVRALAIRNHVHPAIVAGRVRYERHNYKLLAKWVGTRAVRKLFPTYKAGDVE